MSGLDQSLHGNRFVDAIFLENVLKNLVILFCARLDASWKEENSPHLQHVRLGLRGKVDFLQHHISEQSIKYLAIGSPFRNVYTQFLVFKKNLTVSAFFNFGVVYFEQFVQPVQKFNSANVIRRVLRGEKEIGFDAQKEI